MHDSELPDGVRRALADGGLDDYELNRLVDPSRYRAMSHDERNQQLDRLRRLSNREAELFRLVTDSPSGADQLLLVDEHAWVWHLGDELHDELFGWGRHSPNELTDLDVLQLLYGDR
jgi:hypothetical protein